MSFSKGKTTKDVSFARTREDRVDPAFQQAAENFNDRAQETANNYQPINIPKLPGLAPDQLTTQDRTRNLVSTGSTLGSISDRLANISGIRGSSIDPSRFSISGGGVSAGQATASLANRGDIRDVASDPAIAAQFQGEDLRRILSEIDPSFTDDVISRTQLANERQRQIQRNMNSDAAIAAGAFGGSRDGVAQSLTNEAFDRNDLDIALGINQSDLERMQQASLFNSDQSLRADTANQGVDFGVASQNAALGTNTSIANAGNKTRASIAGAQIGVQGQIASMQAALQASLANQRNSFNTQAFNSGLEFDVLDRQTGIDSIERNRALQDIELLNSIGGQNRGLELGQRDVGIQNDVNAQQAELMKLDILRMGLGELPINPTTNRTISGNETIEQFGSPLSIAGGAIQLGGQIVPLFPGFGSKG